MENLSTQENLDENTEDIQQFLTFLLSGERYGIGILHVKEIIEYGSITTVPSMPDFIAGVINLRGSVVPVVDLACRFQTQKTELTKKTSIIVVEITEEEEMLELGIIVDMVNDVLELKPDMLSPAPSFGTTIRTDFIKYMGKLNNGHFIIILDMQNVLSVDELSAVSEAAEFPRADES